MRITRLKLCERAKVEDPPDRRAAIRRDDPFECRYGGLAHGAVEIRREVGLAVAPLKLRWQDSMHGAAQDESAPAVTELLLRRQGEAEFHQPPVKKRIARLQTIGGCRLVRKLEHMRNDR